MLSFECPRRLVESFKRQAKSAFPKETLSYIYGQIHGTSIVVEGIWVPDDVLRHCTHTSVTMLPHWDLEAIDVAKDQDAVVLGTIHSHPFCKDELYTASGKFAGMPGMEQSAIDIESCGIAWQQISGICRVTENLACRLRASVKFWGPTVPLIVKLTSTKCDTD